MAYAPPSLDQMFDGLTPTEQVAKFEAYKSALSAVQAASYSAARNGEVMFVSSQGIVKTSTVGNQIDSIRANITKAVSGDQLAAAETALAQLAEIQKDLTLTSPLNSSVSGISGLVPYDLDPVLSLLIPKELYFRNTTARIKAQGQALEFRRITGLSNAGVGGVGTTSTFFSSASAGTSFGGVTLNRPGKISYAADKIVKSFVEQGLSDSVALQAEFAGHGYTDLRQLSHTALIWATWLGEERNIVNACSTALSTAGLTFTGAADATGTGITTGTAGSQVYVTLSSAYGETASLTAGATITTVSGQGAKVTFTGTIPNQCVAINIYVVTTTVETYKATITQLASGGTGSTALAFTKIASSDTHPVADNSYNTNAAGANSGTGYDGFVNTLLSTSGGYQKQLNATIASQSAADAFAQDAFVSLFNSTMADPELIATTAAVRRSIAAAIQGAISTSTYRLTYETGQNGVVLGSLVQAIQNQSTGTMVELVTHRFLPAGVALVHQKMLPFPDSGVGSTVEIHNVVDSMIVEWPQIGFTYDISSYIYGSIAFRAPAWSGAITGITG